MAPTGKQYLDGLRTAFSATLPWPARLAAWPAISTSSTFTPVAAWFGLPAGLLTVAQGIGEQAGDALVKHLGIDRISCTGSPGAARLIGQAAAR